MHIELNHHTVDVFLINTDLLPRTFNTLELSSEERVRMQQMKSTKRATEFFYARSMLRRILAYYLPGSPLPIEENDNGKPFLNLPQAVYFNLSHSQQFLVIAVTELAPVGIDIENSKPRPFAKIAAGYFSDQEYLQLNQLAHANQADYFYSIWTAKEALAKAIGHGLSRELAYINIFSLTKASHIAYQDRTLKLFPLRLHPDYQTTLACSNEIQRVRLWLYDKQEFHLNSQFPLA